MPNPGSPEQMRAMQQNAPMPKNSMMGMFAVLIIMMAVMMFREAIGKALNVVFHFIDFSGELPVLTLIIAGLLMITLSTVVRGFMTDPLEQAKSQQMQSEFNAEFRQARQENNMYKLKKLQELQPVMMEKSMAASGAQMKVMPITMIIIMPIYAWVLYFITNTAVDTVISMPWGSLNLLDTAIFMPYWIIIYTMISLPIGQLENRLVRYIVLKKRLKQLENVY